MATAASELLLPPSLASSSVACFLLHMTLLFMRCQPRRLLPVSSEVWCFKHRTLRPAATRFVIRIRNICRRAFRLTPLCIGLRRNNDECTGGLASSVINGYDGQIRGSTCSTKFTWLHNGDRRKVFKVRCLRLYLTVKPHRFCCEIAVLMPCPSILVTLSSSLELLYRENSSAEFSLKEDHRQRTIIDKDKKLSHVAVLTEPCRVYTNLAVACVHHHTRTVCPNYFCSPKRKKIEKKSRSDEK